ncbi:dicarboxylate/amino acid:cation symporter [soil metagenome]
MRLLNRLIKLEGHWQILLALVLGAVAGGLTNALGWGGEGSALVGGYAFLGDLFLRALKMIIVPLIFSSIVIGIAGLGEIEGFGRLGFKTLGYYLLSTACAVTVGLTVVNLIDPGLTDGEPDIALAAAIAGQDAEAVSAAESRMAAAEESDQGGMVGLFLDMIQRMIPPNFIAAASDNGQLLSLIFVSLLTAFGIVKLPPGVGKEALLGFFSGLNALMLVVTGWIMLFAPIGVFGLLAETVANTGAGLFVSLLKYFVTVVAALLIHLFGVLPLILIFVGRVNPWRHFAAMKDALVTAFSTASSSATLPITMRCIQKNAGVSKRVTSFVLPLGATVNMDGTALYECVAVLFIAQVLGQELDVAQQFFVVVLALMTSIGVAGVPSASLVAIIIILNNVGIQGAAGAIGAILAVDRLLDMTRTAVNIFSDSCGAVVIARTEGEDGILTAPPPPQPSEAVAADRG